MCKESFLDAFQRFLKGNSVLAAPRSSKNDGVAGAIQNLLPKSTNLHGAAPPPLLVGGGFECSGRIHEAHTFLRMVVRQRLQLANLLRGI
jgi:hypothetical protein